MGRQTKLPGERPRQMKRTRAARDGQFGQRDIARVTVVEIFPRPLGCAGRSREPSVRHPRLGVPAHQERDGMSKMGVLLERRRNFRYASVEGKKNLIEALIRNDGLHERRQDRGCRPEFGGRVPDQGLRRVQGPVHIAARKTGSTSVRLSRIDQENRARRRVMKVAFKIETLHASFDNPTTYSSWVCRL